MPGQLTLGFDLKALPEEMSTPSLPLHGCMRTATSSQQEGDDERAHFTVSFGCLPADGLLLG